MIHQRCRVRRLLQARAEAGFVLDDGRIEAGSALRSLRKCIAGRVLLRHRRFAKRLLVAMEQRTAGHVLARDLRFDFQHASLAGIESLDEHGNAHHVANHLLLGRGVLAHVGVDQGRGTLRQFLAHQAQPLGIRSRAGSGCLAQACIGFVEFRREGIVRHPQRGVIVRQSPQHGEFARLQRCRRHSNPRARTGAGIPPRHGD